MEDLGRRTISWGEKPKEVCVTQFLHEVLGVDGDEREGDLQRLHSVPQRPTSY